MKKFNLTLLFCIFSVAAFCHQPVNNFDYSIVFSGSFKDDLVSLSINKKEVLSKIKIENVDADKKGHLSITQTENELVIFYNSVEIRKRKVAVDMILELELSINRSIKKMKVDLRKGKVILINSHATNKTVGKQDIFIEQLSEPFILI
jgi:hypothetical protein